jgi:thioredoxin-related protein
MMRTAIVFSLLASLSIAQDTKQELWMTDFAAARAKAKAENKDLLVDFTGSDWCGWCIKLDEEVFSKDEFKNSAPANFVLVKLDYPKDKTILTEKLIAQNSELQTKYSVQGFPTILLMDADGDVFGQAGYEAGGPAPYNEMLGKKQKAGSGFKAAKAKAMTKKGIERAQALADCLGSLEEQVAQSYHFDIMNEIVQLDADGKAGLKEKYSELVAKIQASRDLQAAGEELQALIGEHMEKGEGEAALAKLEKVIAKPKTPLHQQMAMFFKGMVIMDTTQDVKAAVAALEAASKLAPKSPIAERIQQILPQIKAAGGK